MSLVSQLLDPDELMRLDEADLGRLEAAASKAVLPNDVRERLTEDVKNWRAIGRERG